MNIKSRFKLDPGTVQVYLYQRAVRELLHDILIDVQIDTHSVREI